MDSLSISYRPPGDLRPRVSNPRTHSKQQIRQIAASIQQFGFTVPILIDGNDGVIAGHGRVEAAKQLGMSVVPVICRNDMTEAQVRAYVIADNRLAQNAGWDERLLALEFQEVEALDLNFDLTITGFDPPEIDRLISGLVDDDLVDDVPPLNTQQPPVTRIGDLWQIEGHRLLCSDATQAASYDHLLGNDRAQLVFADPPFNVPIQGHVSGLGRVQHREFPMATGEMTQKQFIEFLTMAFGQMARVSCDGAIHFICMDWRHMAEVLAAGQDIYAELKNLCIWAKSNGGMGSFYRSQHELVFVFKNGTAPHINNIDLGRYGRHRTNVWSYAGANSFGKTRDRDLASHPTVKPLPLVADAIRDCSNRGGIVLDPFAGSGTTLVAAHKTNRRGYGIELDPHYVDQTIARLGTLGLRAIHADSGLTFTELQRERSGQAADV